MANLKIKRKYTKNKINVKVVQEKGPGKRTRNIFLILMYFNIIIPNLLLEGISLVYSSMLALC